MAPFLNGIPAATVTQDWSPIGGAETVNSLNTCEIKPQIAVVFGLIYFHRSVLLEEAIRRQQIKGLKVCCDLKMYKNEKQFQKYTFETIQ